MQQLVKRHGSHLASQHCKVMDAIVHCRTAALGAISNHRLVNFRNDQVSFRGKDYAQASKQKVITVSADEFLRRFLIHVLPKGLVRIRHFGLFANRKRSASLRRRAKEKTLSRAESLIQIP